MTKFITPVSMFCTLAQYEKDLKEPLAKLGYSAVLSHTVPLHPLHIVTNAFGRSDAVAMFSNSLGLVSITAYNRYFINHYNPELFLALAVMSDTEYGVTGEWWVSKKKGGGFTLGGFYQASKAVNESKAFTDDEGTLNGFSIYPLGFFSKATKEELITKVTNDRILREGLVAHMAAEQVLDGFITDLEKARDKTAKDAYEPKNGDKVIGFDHELSSAVQPREGTYIGWESESERHVIRVAPQQLKGFKQVKPIPAEPEITFEPGELVWVKYSEISPVYYARYYARQNGSKHTVFNNQMLSGDTTTVTEIHKFDKRPF